tara:strand:- start:4283 stop:4681 length:399 start_codon:yes stop_codon:yes gene_type:complete
MDTDTKVQLAELKKEVSFTESLLLRVEQHQEQLLEVTTELKSRQDIMEERLATALEELAHMHKDNHSKDRDRIEKYEKLHARISETERHIIGKIEQMNTRLERLETWRWMVIGGAAVVGFLVSLLDFKNLFS